MVADDVNEPPTNAEGIAKPGGGSGGITEGGRAPNWADIPVADANTDISTEVDDVEDEDGTIRG